MILNGPVIIQVNVSVEMSHSVPLQNPEEVVEEVSTPIAAKTKLLSVDFTAVALDDPINDLLFASEIFSLLCTQFQGQMTYQCPHISQEESLVDTVPIEGVEF